MPSNRFPVTLLPGRFAVCRLDASSPVPPWAVAGGLWSVTRTADEVSVVCAEESVPPGVRVEAGWRAFRLEGPVPFNTVGVVSSLTAPLATQGVSVFVLSTFDTDYLLVKEAAVPRARKALTAAGYPVN